MIIFFLLFKSLAPTSSTTPHSLIFIFYDMIINNQ